jgi:hypothetical protein
MSVAVCVRSLRWLRWARFSARTCRWRQREAEVGRVGVARKENRWGVRRDKAGVRPLRARLLPARFCSDGGLDAPGSPARRSARGPGMCVSPLAVSSNGKRVCAGASYSHSENARRQVACTSVGEGRLAAPASVPLLPRTATDGTAAHTGACTRSQPWTPAVSRCVVCFGLRKAAPWTRAARSPRRTQCFVRHACACPPRPAPGFALEQARVPRTDAACDSGAMRARFALGFYLFRATARSRSTTSATRPVAGPPSLSRRPIHPHARPASTHLHTPNRKSCGRSSATPSPACPCP